MSENVNIKSGESLAQAEDQTASISKIKDKDKDKDSAANVNNILNDINKEDTKSKAKNKSAGSAKKGSGKASSRTVKKKIRKVEQGIIYVEAGFNNTKITLTDQKGNTLQWATAGAAGFKGSRKSTPFAAQVAAENLCKQAKDIGIALVEIKVCGPGPGRESVLRAIAAAGIKIISIMDTTPVPHNGVRPSKKRRV